MPDEKTTSELTEDVKQRLRVPAWCPVCDLVMKDPTNDCYWHWGCCTLCFIEHIEDREERWRSGWRPGPPTSPAE